VNFRAPADPAQRSRRGGKEKAARMPVRSGLKMKVLNKMIVASRRPQISVMRRHHRHLQRQHAGTYSIAGIRASSASANPMEKDIRS
jgi:hypothetical protein